MKDKLNEIEQVLGIKLNGGTYDLELFELEWNAFYQNPTDYAGSVVVDMVLQWYNTVYPPKEFVDAYYLDPR